MGRQRAKNGRQPWCQHCRALQPIWEDAADRLNDRISFGKVDCTVNKDVCAEEQIKGYPTILLYRDGKRRPYRGRKQLQDFQEFVDYFQNKQIAYINNGEVYSNVTKGEDAVAVVVYNTTKETSSTLRQVSRWLADSWLVFSFIGPELAHTLQFDEDIFYLIRDGAAEAITLPNGEYQARSASEVYDYVESRMLPLLPALGIHNYWYLTSSNKKAVVALADPMSPELEQFKQSVRGALLSVHKNGKDFMAG